MVRAGRVARGGVTSAAGVVVVAAAAAAVSVKGGGMGTAVVGAAIVAAAGLRRVGRRPEAGAAGRPPADGESAAANGDEGMSAHTLAAWQK